MAKFCIPKEYYTKLQEGIKSGDFDLLKMSKMTTKQRNKLFNKYLPKELAKQSNIGFEKAMYKKEIKNEKRAYEQWANEFFKGEKKAKKNDIISKINSYFEIKDGQYVDKNRKIFLEDLASEELGINLTTDDIFKIKEMSSELNKKKAKVLKNYKANQISQIQSEILEIDSKNDFNSAVDDLIKYLKERENVLNHIKAINPSTKERIFSSTLTRLNLLMGFKSSIVNEVASIAMKYPEKVVRRIFNKTYNAKNTDITRKFVEMNKKIYKETGYELSRMEKMDEDQRLLGEEVVSTAGRTGGAWDKLFRNYTEKLSDIIFRKGFIINFSLGGRDTAYASFNFSDNADITSQTLARKENPQASDTEINKRARDIMLDSMNVDPLTPEGRVIREMGRSAAFYGTFTQDSKSSEIVLKLRDTLNLISIRGFKTGEALIPFAKHQQM